jgi:hypothetical protein
MKVTCYINEVPMDEVEEYYARMAPPPPKIPPPPMSPPPRYSVLYTYQLKDPIDTETARLLWSFFSETDEIYLSDTGPYTEIMSPKILDIPALHKKIMHMSNAYDIRCFDTIYILPGYSSLAHID